MGKIQRMNTTIKEVAHRAKVSIATVSRVLNNVGPADPKTRQRVHKAVKKLHYIPNVHGRGLSTKRTDAIGLLLPDLYGEFFSEVIRGADQCIQQNRYHLLISSSHNNRDEIEAALQMMRGRVDGLVVMSPHIDARTLKTNLPKTLPVVLLNCYVENGAFDSINIDNFDGARQLTLHLIQHGHRRIAIITGPEKNVDASERLRGYRRALKDARIDRTSELEIPGDFSEISGYSAAKKILSLTNRPTAIFASNDSMAIGALSALREAGVALPDDMALGGFDDIPITQYLTPPLTSVHIPIGDLGGIAVNQLIHSVKEKNAHVKKRVVLPTSLSIRESCGCQNHRRSEGQNIIHYTTSTT